MARRHCVLFRISRLRAASAVASLAGAFVAAAAFAPAAAGCCAAVVVEVPATSIARITNQPGTRIADISSYSFPRPCCQEALLDSLGALELDFKIRHFLAARITARRSPDHRIG